MNPCPSVATSIMRVHHGRFPTGRFGILLLGCSRKKPEIATLSKRPKNMNSISNICNEEVYRSYDVQKPLPAKASRGHQVGTLGSRPIPLKALASGPVCFGVSFPALHLLSWDGTFSNVRGNCGCGEERQFCPLSPCLSSCNSR